MVFGRGCDIFFWGGCHLLSFRRDEWYDLVDVFEAVDEAEEVEAGRGGQAAGIIKVLLQAENQLLQPEKVKK